ncbi:hypothetical protein [Humibacter sp.]|uniref:hypothetical protein n=1 Tax=Humibacter sp. TaxID=1940291 RepID=UPI002C4EC4B5|nr:hypothetical protein [Humibacter sp.]HVX07610.1 hypothetical protein [Humibacter sp.]
MNHEPTTDDILQDAIDKIAGTDEALHGAVATRWLVVTEHEWPQESGRTTFSVFRSNDQPPWISLGLLRFATIQEEDRALAPDGE